MAAWRMWSGERDGSPWDVHEHPRTVQMHGHRSPRRVVASEVVDGSWWGWLPAGAEVPRMVYPREALFRVCFPYGPEAEEAAGKGRLVRFAVEFEESA